MAGHQEREIIVRKSVSFAELLHERNVTMTENTAIMTSSLPNMEQKLTKSTESVTELDKLSDRLTKLRTSRLPKPDFSPKPAQKPEISPKPAYLGK